jgi:hypothetical protein
VLTPKPQTLRPQLPQHSRVKIVSEADGTYKVIEGAHPTCPRDGKACRSFVPCLRHGCQLKEATP